MAEATENGGLVFGIRLDNSQLAKDVELSNKLFETIAKSAEETGKVIQHWFSDMQIVPKIDAAKFSKELDQVRTAMTESATKLGQGYNKTFSDLYVAAGNAGAKVREESTKTATSVSEDINKLNGGFTAITGLAGKMFLGVSAGQIVSQMFQTRSYFQDAESSMKVFLGDAEKGSKFIRELKDYAFYNMFEFKDLVGASKQLISYGTAAKDVTGILDKLSNIATGTGANLNDMIGMYNKAKSVGKVDSQGLESWAARGVLVKDTLKDMGEVVSSTGVTFKQLEKVLDKVTGEGGMFHNLMAEQLDNLSASAAQLQDNLTSMWEEMGEKAEPYMKAAIDLAGTLVENYQSIADVVIDVAKVYGAYKLVDMSGLQGIIEQAKEETNLIETFKEHGEEIEKLMSADQAYAMEMSGLKKDTAEYAQAVKDMFNSEKESTAEQLKNIDLLEQAETKRKQVLDANIEAKKTEIETLKSEHKWKEVVAQKTELDALQEQRNASAANMEALAKQKASASAAAKVAAEKADTVATMQNATATSKATVATNLWARAKGALGKAATKLGTLLQETVLANPYALAIAGAVALCQAIYDICTAQTALDEMNKTIDEGKAKGYANAMDEIKKSVLPTIDRIRNLTEGTDAYQNAVDDLVKKYPELKDVLGDEYTKTDLLTKGYDAVKKSIIERNEAAAKWNAVEENSVKVVDKQKAVLDEFSEALRDQGYSMEEADRLTRKFEMSMSSIMDGETLSFDQLDDDLKKVFTEAKSNARSFFNFMTGGMVDAFNIGNYSNQESWSAFYKVSATGGEVKQFDSSLRAMFEQMLNLADAAKKAAEGIEEINEATEESENKKKADEWWNTSVLKDYKDQLEQINGQLQAISRIDWLTEQAGTSNKVAELQKQRNQIMREMEAAQKGIIGDDYNAQKAKYKKQIDLYKSFAQQYTSLEVKRQNEIKKLNDSRNAKGANQDVIDAQIANIYNKTEDDINTLFAKFYGVSDATAAKVKQIFDNALNTPIDAAKVRLNQIREQQERIKNAAANGDTIATKEQQAALEAEAAGLQQVIDLARQAEDERISAMQRIAALQREHDEKSLSAEGKKQKAIKETYDTVRKELASMLEKGQISKEQYEEVLFGLNSDEIRESSDEWVAAYGDYAQKREMLVREWWTKLKDVPEEYLAEAQDKMKKDLAAMDFEQFKKDIKWDKLFEDSSAMTSQRLITTINELQSAFDLIKDDMTTEQLDEYKKAIQTLNDELAAKNPWLTIVKSYKQIRQGQDKVTELHKKEKEALDKKNKAQKEYNDALAKEKELREALENDKNNVELQIQLADATDKTATAKANLTNATNDYAEAAAKAAEAEGDMTKNLGDLFGSLGKVGDVVSQVGGVFSQLGDVMGEDGEKMKELGDTLSSIGDTLSSTMQSLASGNYMQAAITNITGMITTVVASRKKYQQEQKEWKLAQQRFADNLSVSAIETVRNQSKGKNIFYTDYNAQADDATKAYKMAQEKLNAQIDKLEKEGKAKKGQRGGVDWGATGKTTAMGAGAGAAIGSMVLPGIGTAVGAAIGAIGGFVTGLFGGRKKKDIWGGLLTEFPELVEIGVDGEERINTALAEQLIEQGMVNDKTKEMIESAKKYQEEMDAAKQEVTEIVSQLTGDLGNNIMDALVDAFKSGADSAEAFGDTVDKVLENMIKKLIFNAAFSQYFDKLQKQYEDIFMSGASETEKVTMLMNATKEFKDEASAGVETMNEFMRQASEYGDSLGMNLFKADAAQRNAVSGGIANVTQDTAEEMNGRLTQIQSHTFSINESVKQITEFSSQTLIVVRNINSDTSALVRSVESLKATVDDIQIRGVKLKS